MKILAGVEEVWMRSRIIYFLICMVISQSVIYSFEQKSDILAFNSRAESDIYLTPALSIYYADKSIDKNIEMENKDEYIRSLFILAKAYTIIDDLYMAENFITKAIDYINQQDYIYDNSSFYIFVVRSLYAYGNYEVLTELISNESIVSILNDRALIEFNIINIKMDITLNNKINFELLKNSKALCHSFDFMDLEAELNIIHGDFVLNTNGNLAKTLYNKAVEIADPVQLTEALFRLGDMSGSIEYIEQAFLISEKFDNYNLSKKILDKLSSEYKARKDYKNLTLTLNKIKYYSNKKGLFLLNQYKKLYNFGYHKEQLALELETAHSLIYLFTRVIISMGVIILVLIIFLSIQSYRLRGFNI